jgi:hypothetical protein
MTAALQLFSKFNCKELLLYKYVNAKDIPTTSDNVLGLTLLVDGGIVSR